MQFRTARSQALRWLRIPLVGSALPLALASPISSALDAKPESGVELAREPAQIARELDAELRLERMAFVDERADRRRLTVRADQALYRPNSTVAELTTVQMELRDSDARENFDIRCDRGEFDIESTNFLAEGNVRGSAGDGRRYRAPWVRYDREQDLLYSDAPVRIEHGSGRFAADGFRYSIATRRFRMIGNVRMEQDS